MSTLTESIGTGLSVVTAATAEPVTLAEAKAWLKVEHSSDDTLIESTLIPAARAEAATMTRRTFIETSFRLTLDRFPSDERGGVIRLPAPPLLSITSITYTDTAGSSQTVSSANYRVDTYKEPGEIEPAYGYYWPSVREITGTVVVTFKAGYGTSASSVPAVAKQLILAIVAASYAKRQPDVIGSINSRTDLIERLAAPLDWGSYN